MPNDTDNKDASDLEREFETELKKEKRPEASLLPEEAEFEEEYAEEMPEETPPKRQLDPYAEKFLDLSTKKFKNDAELDNAVSKILNEIERDYFFKGLLQKTKKGGKLLLQRGVKTFSGVPAFQAVSSITQLVRGNLKVTLGTFAKRVLKGLRAETVPPVLKTLGFTADAEAADQNRDAWQNFANVCKESFDYLARNLNENADDPLEASKLSSEAFSAAVKKVEAERKSVAVQKAKKVVVAKPITKTIVVNRTVTLTLGLICIVLAASLVGAIAYYAPLASNSETLAAELEEKENLISSMNATIISLQSSLNQSSNIASSKDSQIAALNYQISNLFNYLNLNVSAMLVYNQSFYQEANTNTSIYYDVVQFAGYVTVQVQSSSNTTYVRLAYSSYGVNYDNTIVVGTAGTAAFPVLPGIIDLRVGNTEESDAVGAAITATYTY
ncbi:MAG: hypothetical protein NWE94_02085 [Candidatus Bathyarchaeota archaeon]|nr:hypothetical protein [Candidatus Bathyarchaeota archaeon]